MRARICLEWPSVSNPPSTACSAKRKLSRYSIGSTPMCQSSGIASQNIGMSSVSSCCSSAPFSHMAPVRDMVAIFDLSFSSSSISSSPGLIHSSNSIPPGKQTHTQTDGSQTDVHTDTQTDRPIVTVFSEVVDASVYPLLLRQCFHRM